jgi:putative tributyrin esterase
MLAGVITAKLRTSASAVACLALALSTGCRKKEAERIDSVVPGIKTGVYDVVFRSASLGRQMKYRIVLPTGTAQTKALPIVYFLHGVGGDFRDWSTYSDVERLAEGKLVLIMPQGDSSYYMNAAGRPTDRYEDYIVQDIPSDVEAKFPLVRTTEKRAIVGVSMGGFGAIKIAMTHPNLYVFAGAMSPPLDVPRRPFSLRRIQQSWSLRSIFGPWGSDTRRHNDPFLIARASSAANMPFLYLSCGEDESLLLVNRQFAAVLREQQLACAFHIVPGGHEWKQWNAELPRLFAYLFERAGNGP